MKKLLKQQLQTLIDEKYLCNSIDKKTRKNLLKDVEKFFNYKFIDDTTDEMIQDGTIFLHGVDPVTKKCIAITIHNSKIKIN